MSVPFPRSGSWLLAWVEYSAKPLYGRAPSPSLSAFLHSQCDQLPALCRLLTMALGDIPGKVGKGNKRGRVCDTVVFSGYMCVGVFDPTPALQHGEYGVMPLTPQFFPRTGSSGCYPCRTTTPSKTKGQFCAGRGPREGILGREN